jgi:hypothetical protein
VGVDGAPAAPSKDHDRGRRAGRFAARIETMLTGLAQGFVDKSSKRFWFFGAFAPGFVRLVFPLRFSDKQLINKA